MQYHSRHKLYQHLALGLFSIFCRMTVCAQDVPPMPTVSAPSNYTELSLLQPNSIGWGLGYIATDAGTINSGFAPTGIQFSTSYARKFSSLFALEGSAHLMNSSFVLDNGFSNDNPDTVFSAAFTKILSHSLTGTISGIFSPFQDHGALSNLSFGAGVSLRWSGRAMTTTNINTANQSFQVGTSVFVQSIAIGGNISISYTIPLSVSTDMTLRAFTDIFLPRLYIVDKQIPAQYQTALSILPTRLIPLNDTFYKNGGVIGLIAIFRVNF